jgi:hypothetical protein
MIFFFRCVDWVVLSAAGKMRTKPVRGKNRAGIGEHGRKGGTSTGPARINKVDDPVARDFRLPPPE